MDVGRPPLFCIIPVSNIILFPLLETLGIDRECFDRHLDTKIRAVFTEILVGQVLLRE